MCDLWLWGRCIAESGTCGPDFKVPGVEFGFTALAVSGPVEKVIVIETGLSDREANMWKFTELALEFLEQCVLESVVQRPQQKDSKL